MAKEPAIFWLFPDVGVHYSWSFISSQIKAFHSAQSIAKSLTKFWFHGPSRLKVLFQVDSTLRPRRDTSFSSTWNWQMDSNCVMKVKRQQVVKMNVVKTWSIVSIGHVLWWLITTDVVLTVFQVLLSWAVRDPVSCSLGTVIRLTCSTVTLHV